MTVFDFKDMSIEIILMYKSFNLPNFFLFKIWFYYINKDVYKKPDLKIFKIDRKTDI